MRSYCAIYVDVGYLLASAATRVTGTSLRRGVEVNHPELISGLVERAEADSGLPLLRVNWYDSGARPGGMPDYVQDEIGLLPRVKLRLGRLSHTGEQKGVDLRIGLDLATHGRNRVVDVIYLVSGDDDLTEAVEEAQGHGVQVILLAVPGQDERPHGVARHLQRAADGLILLDADVIDHAVRSRAIPEALIPEEHRPEGEAETQDDAQDATPGDTHGAQDDRPADDAAPAPEPSAGTEPGTEPELSADENGSPADPLSGLGQPSEPGTDQAQNGHEEAAPLEPESSPPHPDQPAVADTGVADPPADAPDTTHDTTTHDADASPAYGPTPSLFARKRATALIAPPDPVWSTSTGTGGSGSFGGAGVDPELIDMVARQVVRSWCTTATPAMLAELKDQRPFIPGDLDRALLVDVSNRSGAYDIDEVSRHELRNRFWQIVELVKLS